MGRVAGRVVVMPADRGVDGLLVSAYTVPAGEQSSARVRKRRLGSVITGPNGSFTIEYGAGERESPLQAEAWQLTVTVEVPGETPSSPLASETRDDAAPLESFRFVIRESRLNSAGVTLPAPISTDDLILRRRADRLVQQKLDQEESRLLAEHLDLSTKRRSHTAPQFQNFLGRLSSASSARREHHANGYLPPDANIEAENVRAIRHGLAEPFSHRRVSGGAVIEDDARNALVEKYGAALKGIPADQIEHLAWPWKKFVKGVLIAWPRWKKCGHDDENDCVRLLEGETPAETPHPPDAPNGDQPQPPAVTGPIDLATLVHVQSDSATSPETPASITLRAALQDVQAGVDGFLLRSGPADSPAMFDFHHLRIAFEPVWQELFDDRFSETAHELYSTLAEAGVDPNTYLFTEGDQLSLTFAKKNVTKAKSEKTPPPDASVVKAFEITDAEWDALLKAGLNDELVTLAKYSTGEEPSPEETKVKEIADAMAAIVKLFPGVPVPEMPSVESIRRGFRRQGTRMISYARGRALKPDKLDQFHQLLEDLEKSIKEPFRFNVYAANQATRSINFGVVVNYRQRWEPVAYQVGELVKTVPLAPKEVRRFSKRTTIKRSRSEKEVDNSLHTRRTETSDTWRAESEIVSKATSKTNFQLGAQGGVNIGIANASGSTALSHDTASESHEVKKQFREAVFKAAEEYKQERTLQVETTESVESTAEDSGEISNPNDEIPVTYLFYQLQRRYRVSEEIRSVTPVVLVAQEFPKPSHIDNDWIVRHDWILRRCLLDDSFQPALNYLASKIVGDEVALRELFENLQQHRRLVEEVKDEVIAIGAQVASRYTALELAIAKHADAVQAEESDGGIVPMPVGFLVEGSDVSVEATRLREESARDALERAAKEEKELQARLDRETTALASATDTYVKQLSEHLNRVAQVDRLRVHIKQNIFYYMQAIWSHEPPDQRYFRLHDVSVPRLVGTKTYDIEIDEDAVPMPPDWKKPHKLTVHSDIDAEHLEFDALGDVADLDNLMGFKGNFMIFPMRERNDITDVMMTPYYDQVARLRDPDPLGDWTLQSFAEYVCCLKDELSEEQFERKLPGLIETYRLLKEHGADDGEIIVPTDSLYIEALPGVRPVLEDFKLLHRAVDVKRAMADVRAVELENLRMAARLLAGEREDPTIEKKVVIEGSGQPVVVTDNP